jgi:glucose-6-phosphate dehydrogenase assembly protein OpcA
MSAATIDSFLEGQGIPVDLRQIETELAKLWGPAAEQVGGPELESPNVTRIVLANLVVMCLEGRCEHLGPVLETVIARFPCRAIVVRGAEDPVRRVSAEVSALCHLPAPGLPQVCSERIVLRAGKASIDLVPGAIRPLLEAELPMILWWTGDPCANEELFRDLADECSRMVLDLPDPGTLPGALRLGLDPSVCESSRDSVWFGIARWRELIAQFFDPPCSFQSLNKISAVSIEAVSPDAAQPPRIAIWLAAWLAGQLGWKSRGRPKKLAEPDGSKLVASFDGPAGPVSVEIVTRSTPAGLAPSPRLLSVVITAGSQQAVETFRLTRPTPDSSAVVVETIAQDACALPRVVEAPELDPARRISAALESSRFDPPFQKALPFALELLDPEAGT